MNRLCLILWLVLATAFVKAQDTLSITLENVKYPFPVKFYPMNIEGQDVRMAYMDIMPANPNGKTILLLHGKNFGGY